MVTPEVVGHIDPVCTVVSRRTARREIYSRHHKSAPHGVGGRRPAGPEIVGVRLTAAACAHGLALARPEKGVMARPTGCERGDAICVRVPIEGSRDEGIA